MEKEIRDARMTSKNPDVVIGEEGWLFLDAGSNDFMSYLRGVEKLPPTTIFYWQIILTNRKRWFEKAGIKYIHIFAPEKVTVYPEYYGDQVDTSLGHIGTLSKRCPDLFVNVLNFFRSIKDTHQIYDKTDSHWNRVGAFACYQVICSALGYKPLTDLIGGATKRVNAMFDLGLKLDPPLREWVELVQRSPKSLREFANLLVRFKEKNRVENEVGLHVGSRVVFRNDTARYKEKVIIFGDSFSEYRPGRLTEMFAETFSEVHFCWSSNVDFDYVQRIQPHIVITELAERCAVATPSDRFRVDRFSRERLGAYLRERRLVDTRTVEPPLTQAFRKVVSGKPRSRSGSKLPMTGARGPDYLIVGAMKCGTTILNDFISDHPDVFAAKQKEIHYFTLYYDKGESWYADFFSEVPDGKVTGEASPTYLDMANGLTIPKLIHATLPDIRIIAIIKDPVDRAISHFFHLRNINKLPAVQNLDPNEVFSGDLFRKYHNDFLRNPALWPLRNVLDFGNYFLRLHMYKHAFGDKFIVINNRDLWENGQSVMDRVFKHLGLSTYQSAMFERKAYVTSSSLKQIDPGAIRCLEEYYRPDMEMLKQQFRIKFR